MPRKAISPAASIIEFFKTASPEVAEMVLALATAEVKARRPKSATANEPTGAKRGRKPKGVSGTVPAAPDVLPLGEKG